MEERFAGASALSTTYYTVMKRFKSVIPVSPCGTIKTAM
jgi:hypothetical protein